MLRGGAFSVSVPRGACSSIGRNSVFGLDHLLSSASTLGGGDAVFGERMYDVRPWPGAPRVPAGRNEPMRA